MKTQSLHDIETGPDRWDRRRAELAERTFAMRRAEAVLRILKDRSTLVDEAVRMGVDIETVAAWLAVTLGAIGRALEAELPVVRGTVRRIPRHQLLAS
jgi:hypothetical protein